MPGVWWRATSSITNNVRLNSAVGYITPKDMLAGRQREIHAEGDRKLKVARKLRQVAGSRLRDTLWGHCTRSPHLIPLTDACQGVRPENGMFRHTIKAEVVFQSAFEPS